MKEQYSPDDNRKELESHIEVCVTYYPHIIGFDLRQFLYPSRFPWQFKKIDAVAASLPDRSRAPTAEAKQKIA